MQNILEKISGSLLKEGETAFLELESRISALKEYKTLLAEVSQLVSRLSSQHKTEVEEVLAQKQELEGAVAVTKEAQTTLLKNQTEVQSQHDAQIASKQQVLNDMAEKEERLQKIVAALLAEAKGTEESVTGLRIQELQLQRSVADLQKREKVLQQSLEAAKTEQAQVETEVSIKRTEFSRLQQEASILEARKK